MPKEAAITFTPGIPPLWTKLIKYYDEGSLAGTSRWKTLKTRAEVWLVAILLLANLTVAAMWMTNL